MKIRPSTAAVSGPSVACSVHMVQQQRKLCRQFIDMSAVWRGCHTTRHALQIMWVYRRLVSASPRCTLACVQEATCELARTVCTGPSLRLVTSATLGEPESHGHAAWDPEQYVPQHGFTETVPVWKLEDQPARHYCSPIADQRHVHILSWESGKPDNTICIITATSTGRHGLS